MLRTLATTLVAAGMLAAAFPQTADACSCAEPNIERDFNNYDQVMRANIRFEIPNPPSEGPFGERWYAATVEDSYKGCMERFSWVIIRTNRSGPACGVMLPKGSALIAGLQSDKVYGMIPSVRVSSCSHTRSWDYVEADDLDWITTHRALCEPTTSAGCSYGGVSYEVGDSFPDADDCNTCTCTEFGITCTEMFCR